MGTEAKRSRSAKPGTRGERRTSRRVLSWLPYAIPVLFLCLQIARGYPFEDDVNPTASAGQDWLSYKQYALSILHEGWDMPVVEGEYRRPGGILYSYFVALIFAIFGENTSHVYLVQALLLGLSVAVMYWAIRPYVSPFASVAFLVIATWLAYIDVFRWYSKTLLSENLLLYLIPPYYLALTRGFDRKSSRVLALSGLIFGLATLTRPNVVLIAPATALLILFLNGKERWRLTGSFVLAFVLTQFALVARNYSVTQRISAASFSPILAETADWRNINPETLTVYPVTSAARGSIRYYLDRAFFSVGITPYGVVKRWVAIWIGVAVFLGLCLMRRRIAFWEAAFAVFLILYLVPLVIAGGISVYGVRMVLPVVPSALALAVRGVDMLSDTRRQK